MSTLGTLFSMTMAAQTLRAAVPYVLASQGGVWSERSGVVNVALEGTMLVGGLMSVATALATGSVAAGIGAAALSGALVGLLHVCAVELGRVDGIVSGLAINLAAAGGTRVLLRAWYGSSSNSPSLAGGGSASTGLLLLGKALVDPMTIVMVFAVLATPFVLQRTRLGLRVRGCGESPEVLRAAGVSVFRTRAIAVAIGCALAALGGAALALEQRQFQSGMSGGRGFIALAAVVLAGWRPGRATLACAAFAVLDAVQVVLQGQARAFEGLLQALPYLATLVALVVLVRRRTSGGAPAALGRAERTS